MSAAWAILRVIHIIPPAVAYPRQLHLSNQPPSLSPLPSLTPHPPTPTSSCPHLSHALADLFFCAITPFAHPYPSGSFVVLKKDESGVSQEIFRYAAPVGLSICPCAYACPCLCLSICPCTYVCPCVSLSICPCAYVCPCVSLCMSVCVCLSACVSVHVCVRLCVCLRMRL